MKIRVGSTKVLEYEKSLVLDVLDSNQLSPGPMVKRFEEEFSRSHEVKHSIFMNSGTDALRIALLAMKEKYGWQDGDQVLVPAITFVATVNVVIQCGLEPILVDVGMCDYMMNSERYRRKEWRAVGSGMFERHVNTKVEPRTRAILIVHLFGQPAEMDSWLEIAKEHHLKVIEDSCETMGVRYKGRMVGSFGEIACFSTYSCHCLSTGVGGIASTNDEELMWIMRSLMNHGRDPAYIPGYTGVISNEEFLEKHFKFDRIGYSARATEMQAAIGLGQLRVMDELKAKRQANAKVLYEGLRYVPGLLQQGIDPSREHAYMMYPVVIREGWHRTKRDVMLQLLNAGIECRDFMPIASQPCYKGRFNPEDVPTATSIINRSFYIGCHAELTQNDLEVMIHEIKKALA